MNQNLPESNTSQRIDDDEIDLLDIADFFLSHWKKLLLGSLVGALLGMFGSIYFLPFQAELILDNKLIQAGELSQGAGRRASKLVQAGGLSRGAGKRAFDYVSWRSTSISLPNLAAQMLAKQVVPDKQVAVFENMSSRKWWAKNVQPVYSVDIKEAKKLRLAKGATGDSILYFQINATHQDKQQAIDNSLVAASFIKSGAKYVQLTSYLSSLRGEISASVSDANNWISRDKIALGYKQKRLASLEALRNKYLSDEMQDVQQVGEVREQSAKFLPIITQIIAINREVIDIQEDLQKYHDVLANMEQKRLFLEQAEQLVDEGRYDGERIFASMFELHEKMQQAISEGNLIQEAAMDEIDSRLTNIHTGLAFGLSQSTAPRAEKKGGAKYAAIGLFLGFFLVLAWALVQKLRGQLEERHKGESIKS